MAVGAYAGIEKALFEMTPEAVTRQSMIRICVDVEVLDSAPAESGSRLLPRKKRSAMWSAMVMKVIRVHLWIEVSWKVIRTV